MSPHLQIRIAANRWWVLAIVVAAQFMFVMDAFIVNVALPTIRADLGASPAEMQAVLAFYQIAYAALVITGGRLGDIHGRKRLFLSGVLGFTAASVWCGLTSSGTELVLARIVQGGTAALMSPQVLATIHTLFPDAARAKAFAVFGIALGIGGALGFVLGGWLVTLDLAGVGWRMVFFVNLPVGLGIAWAAWRAMPDTPPQRGVRLDLPGAVLLFAGLACLVGPIMAAPEHGRAWWLWLLVADGALLLAGFLWLERRTAQRGGTPLIDLALLTDTAFQRGLCAVFALFTGNIAFYLVITLFLQQGLHLAPLAAGVTLLPPALAFVLASRLGAAAVVRDGVNALMRGCVVQLVGLGSTASVILLMPAPVLLIAPLALFCFGQGLVLAPLYGVVLAQVRPAQAGAGAGVLTTVQQIGNGTGVAAIGALYVAVQLSGSDRVAVLAAMAALSLTVIATLLLLHWMRRAA